MILSFNSNVWRSLFIISLFFICFFSILFYFQDIFIILIIGAVLLLVCEKLFFFFNKLMNRFPNLNRKTVGVFLLSFFFLSFICLVSNQMHAIAALITEASAVHQDYSSGSSALLGNESGLSKLMESKILKSEDLQSIGNAIFSEFTGLISKVSYYLFSGILIIPLMFSSYYKQRKNFDNYVYKYLPPKYAEALLRAIKKMGKELEDYFSAKMIESAVVGLICCIGFFLAGVNGWFFLGIFAGFLNIIPYIGPLIGAIPPIIIGYLSSPETAILAAITVVVAQLVDNFYLIPFMISEKVNINPLLSVVLTLGASKMLGALGMIFAIPIFIIYKIIIIDSYEALVRIYPEVSEGKEKVN